MAPLVIITVPCENKPCNLTNTLVHLMANLTSTNTPDGAEEDYDHQGAARFIIATVLVYSLMGMFGMLLLRIKRSASRSRRSTSTREETVLKYIKKTDRLMLEARRDVMKKEAERTSERLNFIQQKSVESSTSTTNPDQFSLSNSFNLSTSFNSSQFRMPYSPTSTSLSLLMPLLPAVQETTAENTNNSQNDVPKVVFHFPALPPLTIPQSIIGVQAHPSSVTPSCTSTPVTLIKELSYLPSGLSTMQSPSSNTTGLCEESSISKSSSHESDNTNLDFSNCADISDNNSNK